MAHKYIVWGWQRRYGSEKGKNYQRDMKIACSLFPEVIKATCSVCLINNVRGENKCSPSTCISVWLFLQDMFSILFDRNSYSIISISSRSFVANLPQRPYICTHATKSGINLVFGMIPPTFRPDTVLICMHPLTSNLRNLTTLFLPFFLVFKTWVLDTISRGNTNQ